MLEDTLKELGRPMTPPVIKLLETLSPKKEAREWIACSNYPLHGTGWTQAVADVHHSPT